MENEKDGIEGRATEFLDALLKRELHKPTVESAMAMFATAETTTLTTQLNEMQEALWELVEAAEQAAKDSAGIFAMAHFRGEGYTGRTYEQEIAKAKVLLDKSGED